METTPHSKVCFHYCSSRDMAMAIFNISSSASSSLEGSFFCILWKIESHPLIALESHPTTKELLSALSKYWQIWWCNIPYIPQYNECRRQCRNHPPSFCLESNARLEPFLQQRCVCHRGHKSRVDFRCHLTIPLRGLPHRKLVPENICIYQNAVFYVWRYKVHHIIFCCVHCTLSNCLKGLKAWGLLPKILTQCFPADSIQVSIFVVGLSTFLGCRIFLVYR